MGVDDVPRSRRACLGSGSTGGSYRKEQPVRFHGIEADGTIEIAHATYRPDLYPVAEYLGEH